MRDIIEENTVTQVNENGEFVKEVKKVVYKRKSEDKFVKFYVNDLSGLAGVSATGLLYQLLARMEYNGMVSLSVVDRKVIAAELGVIPGVVNNQLQKLKKKDVIRSFDKGVFIINPFMFARGAWSQVEKRRAEWLKGGKSNQNKKTAPKSEAVIPVQEEDDFE
ncbi:MAG: replication/maintenance protein RepL [Neptuniibacter sp.]